MRPRRPHPLALLIAAFAVLALTVRLSAARGPAASAQAPATNHESFSERVAPIISNTCQPCHNARLSSGGVDLTPFTDPRSLAASREGWEVIVRKLRAGEMPPKGVPRPPQADIDAMIGFLDGQFDEADRNVTPDPGRVTARRLNRTEYNNTVRDLLAVDTHPADDFPQDDFGNAMRIGID
ncbi:MAG: DUF1587 domain-containing protein [Acidobacteriota bacterium]